MLGSDGDLDNPYAYPQRDEGPEAEDESSGKVGVAAAVQVVKDVALGSTGAPLEQIASRQTGRVTGAVGDLIQHGKLELQ